MLYDKELLAQLCLKSVALKGVRQEEFLLTAVGHEPRRAKWVF